MEYLRLIVAPFLFTMKTWVKYSSESEKDLTKSYEKNLYTNRQFKNPIDNTNMPPKSSI